MKFVFPGDPISRRAHKHGTKKGKSYTYDSQIQLMRENKELLKRIVLDLKSTHLQELTELARARAFEVQLTFYLPFPSKFGKRQIKAILEGIEPNIADVYPDLDNMEKFYNDVGNKIIYSDDRKIISVNKKKLYDLNPRTELTITPVGVL